MAKNLFSQKGFYRTLQSMPDVFGYCMFAVLPWHGGRCSIAVA